MPAPSVPGSPGSPGSRIIPCLRYRDAHAAIDWLCRAFGFERHAVHADGDTVHHAQLTYAGGMVMLGSTGHASVWGDYSVQPDEVGGRETQSCCVVVDDADAHHAVARAAGAEILIAIGDQDHGGRGYACRDLEGHLWWFGSYDPWSADATEQHDQPAAVRGAALDAGA